MHHLLQQIAPQRALTHFAGWVSRCRCPKIKNWILRRFIKKYQVNLAEAQLEKIEDYPDFNSFFTRQLKPELRPIVQGSHTIASPVDGCVSQIGYLQKDSLLQAKGFHFNLTALLGDEKEASVFIDGAFTTLYLAPKDYHRVHMPFAGKLKKTIFIPGKLFSVSRSTTHTIPHLFSRNERLVCLFETEAGPMTVILIGAMLVGSMSTVWETEVACERLTVKTYPNGPELAKGAELGLFKMGSTVIVLFGKDKIRWETHLKEDSPVKMGEFIGEIK